MAKQATDWVSLERLKASLNFYKDAEGNYPNTDQDTKLVDAIEGAVSWVASYTGLPLLEREITCSFPREYIYNPADGLYLRKVLYFDRVSGLRSFPHKTRLQRPIPADTLPNEWRPISKGRVSDWLIYPPGNPAKWPLTDAQGNEMLGGIDLDIVTSVPVAGHPEIVSAIILTARDLYDMPAMMERRTAAEHLLHPFRYRTTVL